MARSSSCCVQAHVSIDPVKSQIVNVLDTNQLCSVGCWTLRATLGHVLRGRPSRGGRRRRCPFLWVFRYRFGLSKFGVTTKESTINTSSFVDFHSSVNLKIVILGSSNRTMRTKLFFVLTALALSVHVCSSLAEEASAGKAVPGQASDQNPAQNNDPATNAGDGAADAANPAANDVNNSGAQGEGSAGTADDSNNEEDVDNIKGMSDSLAEYLLEKLTGSGNKSEEADSSGGNPPPQASGGADKGSALTPQDADESAGESAGSPAGQEGSSLAAQSSNIASDKDADRSDEKMDSKDSSKTDQWSSTENFAGSSSTTSHPSPRRKIDCKVKVDLKDYCTFTTRANDYFHNDTTLQGLRVPFINMDIVHDLMRCPRGEWCLANMVDVFKDMQDNFYHGPLCDESMWQCIFDILVLREKCVEDKEFVFVVDVLDLLCSLTDVNSLKPGTGISKEDGSQCFAYTLAALHVTYADFLANGMADMLPETEASCQGYGFRMTITHLCADSNCKGQYDSRRAMDKWRRWSWFMANEDERVEKCTGSMPDDVCASMQRNLPHPPASAVPPFWTTTEESGGRHLGPFGEEDESLMVALSVITAVALLFMVLGLVFLWKRSRRRGAYYYRSVSDTYEKDLSDEAHLLSRALD